MEFKNIIFDSISTSTSAEFLTGRLKAVNTFEKLVKDHFVILTMCFVDIWVCMYS